MQILDLPDKTCLNSSESRASDPNGRGLRFNAHCGKILLLDFVFSHSKACDTNIAIIARFD